MFMFQVPKIPETLLSICDYGLFNEMFAVSCVVCKCLAYCMICYALVPMGSPMSVYSFIVMLYEYVQLHNCILNTLIRLL